MAGGGSDKLISAIIPSGPEAVKPNTPLGGLLLGWPAGPEDLFVDAENKPVRIDKAFSWEYPLAVHGMMHNVITNARRGDPYRIDTLFIFMANMAWNSTMNTLEVRKMLNDRDENGEFRIPFQHSAQGPGDAVCVGPRSQPAPSGEPS